LGCSPGNVSDSTWPILSSFRGLLSCTALLFEGFFPSLRFSSDSFPLRFGERPSFWPAPPHFFRVSLFLLAIRFFPFFVWFRRFFVFPPLKIFAHSPLPGSVYFSFHFLKYCKGILFVGFQPRPAELRSMPLSHTRRFH